MRLIDADELNEYIGREALDTREKIFALVDRMPTIEPRLHGKWERLKEHITEMRDADGKANQTETCKFILNLMEVIEREGEASDKTSDNR